MKRAQDSASPKTISGGVAGETPSEKAAPRSLTNAHSKLLRKASLVDLRDWLRGLEDSFQKTTMVEDAEKLLAWHVSGSKKTRDAMAACCKHWDIKQKVEGRKRKAEELAADLEKRLAVEALRIKRAQGCASPKTVTGGVAAEPPSQTAAPRSATNADTKFLKKASTVDLRDCLRGLEDCFQKFRIIIEDAEKLLAWQADGSNKTRDAMASCCKHWDIKQRVEDRKREAEEPA